ncbi:UNVERIFIED_CONTAM: hypothetical protein PYX00_002261 [Menopon gallinae]|uniref:Pyridine nucleotide-disulphide oxidoreductase dimerisation domain-containing protein n=1 Tax=Menopon gallinae TaxID=328185 RepID=A0AAW2IFZ1_9NEOP
MKFISAVEIHYTFPKHTAGARQFGINFDDFYRLSSSPGKTLVVSDSPLGLQCAGILASFHFPVDMVLTSHFFQETDKDIMDKIMKNLKEKGVNFLDCKMVLSVSKKKAGDRLVALLAAGHHKLKRMVEEYDTVLFTSKEHPDFDIFSTTALKREMERLNGIEISSEEKEFLKDVVVIPDMGDKASSEKVGRDVANSLFHREQPQKAQKIIPNILYTPIEYAYYGASENMAKKRIGSECFQVYSGYFHIQEILMGTVETEDTICFIKIVCMPKHDLVLGVHVLGDKADLIINKILENSTEKISITNLHPAIHNRFIELLDMGE